MRNVLLDFGGFYCSIHDELIDNAIESYFEGEEIPEDIDYRKLFVAYSKEYLSAFEVWLSTEIGKSLDFGFVDLISPKYYNYSTDKIEFNLSASNSGKVIEWVLSEYHKETFLSYLEERTKSFDGYMSFYTFEEAMNDKDKILVSYAFDYLVNEFNENQLHDINVFEAIMNEI